MARVTYAVLALAFATLIAGFFFRHSATPLYVSIGLSAVVFVVILGGWSRRLRQAGTLGLALDTEDADEIGEGVVVVDLEETGEIEEIGATQESRRVPSRKPPSKPGPKKKAPAKKAAARKATGAKPPPKRQPRPDDAVFMPIPPGAPARKTPARKKGAPPKTKPTGKAKAPAKAKPKAKPKPRPVVRRVVIVSGRDRYHLPDCRFADAPGARTVGEDVAKRRGYSACSVCLAG